MVLLVSKLKRDTTLRFLLKSAANDPILQSTAKAFFAAYLYAILPRLISLTSRTIRKKGSALEYLERILKLLKRGFNIHGFPVFIAKLVGFTHLLTLVMKRVSRERTPHFTKIMSAFISAKLMFSLYKSALQSHPMGSSTLDITTFTVIRAADLLIRSSPLSSVALLNQCGDVMFFVLSCSIVMFAWFYYPERLPPSYQKWITMAANMDDELVEALRKLRNGQIIYGVKGPDEDLLVPMCVKTGLDPDLGRFSKTVPLPCIVVHSNLCESCELHALWRLYRGFFTALSIYLPINILVSIVSRRSLKKTLFKTTVQSARSSLFLATFIALNWYSVCLVRSRLGPKLFPKLTPQQLEDSYGPGLGSAVCGLGSLIETPKRRGELGLFVAPKALEVLLKDGPEPSPYFTFPVETNLFAVGFACLAAYPKSTRGWLRKLLTMVF